MQKNEAENRFEMEVEGYPAFAAYRLEDNKLYINHVEVDPSLRGKGVAGELMKSVNSYAEEKGLEIIPICSYAVSWMKRNSK